MQPPRAERGSWARLTWSINNRIQYTTPSSPQCGTHTSEQRAQYLQYTRPINSKSCPPSYFIKEACLDDTRPSGLGSHSLFVPQPASSSLFKAVQHLLPDSNLERSESSRQLKKTGPKMKHLTLLLSALSLAVASPTIHSRTVSYDGYQVFRVPVGLDASKVTEIVEKLELDTWKAPNKAGAFADVVVSPEKLQAFNDEVADIEGIEVMHEDLGASIAAEQEPATDVLLDRAAAAINSTWFTAYHNYADHLSFLRGLQAQYPANSEIVTSGNSLQGNAITGIHIYGSAGKGVKPAIIFHGTVHAREWITTLVSQPALSISCVMRDVLLTPQRPLNTSPTSS